MDEMDEYRDLAIGYMADAYALATAITTFPKWRTKLPKEMVELVERVAKLKETPKE